MLKNVLKFSQLIFVLLIFSSCASKPTDIELRYAYYGQSMSEEECAKIADEHISMSLKDPYSAQFKNSKCYRGYWPSVPILLLPLEFGYVQDGYVNAKNAYGVYVGFRPYRTLIRDGKVIRSCISDEDGVCIPSNY